MLTKTGQGLPSCYKHLYNLGKIHKNDFQILNNRQYRTVIPERRKINVMSSLAFFGEGMVVDFLDYRMREYQNYLAELRRQKLDSEGQSTLEEGGAPEDLYNSGLFEPLPEY